MKIIKEDYCNTCKKYLNRTELFKCAYCYLTRNSIYTRHCMDCTASIYVKSGDLITYCYHHLNVGERLKSWYDSYIKSTCMFCLLPIGEYCESKEYVNVCHGCEIRQEEQQYNIILEHFYKV